MQNILVWLEIYAWKITIHMLKLKTLVKKKNRVIWCGLIADPSKHVELLDGILGMLYIRMMIGGIGSPGDHSCTAMD